MSFNSLFTLKKITCFTVSISMSWEIFYYSFRVSQGCYNLIKRNFFKLSIKSFLKFELTLSNYKYFLLSLMDFNIF